MPSQRQINANRKNARKSTGPRTPHGRAAVRNNARFHGLASQDPCLDNEDHQAYQQLLGALIAEHQPATPTETLLVEQVAVASWRLRRVRALETGLLRVREAEYNDNHASLPSYYPQLNPKLKMAYFWRQDAQSERLLNNLFRYETRAERAFFKALEELEHLLSTRPPQREPTESTALPPEPQVSDSGIGFVLQNGDVDPAPTACTDASEPADPAAPPD